MDMVQRYIAAVQRELPEAKREDIGRELNANILDKLEALEAEKGAVSEAEVETVLKAMGHPQTVALQFCPPKPLVSAHLMPLYLHTLYMVLGVLLLISVTEVTSRWLGGAEMSLLLFLKGLASNFLESAYFAFSAITIGFAAMTRNQKGEDTTRCAWSPKKLPPAGKSWQHISLQDIFSDLATMLFLVLLIWYPLWKSDSDVQSIFNQETLTALQWFTPVIVIALVHSLWQLRVRFWNRAMLMLNIAVSSAFFLMAAWMMQHGSILRISPENWKGIMLANIEFGVLVLVFFVAVVGAYEIVRDVRRLRKLPS